MIVTIQLLSSCFSPTPKYLTHTWSDPPTSSWLKIICLRVSKYPHLPHQSSHALTWVNLHMNRGLSIYLSQVVNCYGGFVERAACSEAKNLGIGDVISRVHCGIVAGWRVIRAVQGDSFIASQSVVVDGWSHRQLLTITVLVDTQPPPPATDAAQSAPQDGLHGQSENTGLSTLAGQSEYLLTVL